METLVNDIDNFVPPNLLIFLIIFFQNRKKLVRGGALIYTYANVFIVQLSRRQLASHICFCI